MKTSPNTPSVCFLDVRNGQQKVRRLCDLVREHFEKGEKVVIRVPNHEAADYLGRALWTIPPESFLPHEMVEAETEELVAISTKDGNWNGADVLFHLCPAPSSQAEQFKWIYDLKDGSSATKHQLAGQRYREYQRRGYSLDIR